MRWPSVVGIGLVAVSLGAVGGSWLVAGEIGPAQVATVLCVIYVSIGTYLGIRVPGNAVGWLLAVFGLLLGLSSFLDAYATTDTAGNHWAAWLYSLLWLPALIVLTTFIPILFPDGRLPGPRWRWVFLGSALGWVLFIMGNLFSGEALDKWGLENPTASDIHQSVEFLALVGIILVILGIFAAVRAAFVRYRSSSGAQRLQMKWFVVSASLLIPTFALMGGTYELISQEMAPLILMIGGLGIPFAIAVAVLRYRLYEIDRIVSRTVTYSLVVGLLAGAYFGVAGVVSANVSDSSLFVAGGTLAMAGVFNPLRRKVQTLVERRFNRSRYDADQVMRDFVGALRDQVDPEAVITDWVGAVSKTMQPSTVGVWVRH